MARICQRCSHNNEDHAKFCLSCGAMLELHAGESDDPLIGKVLLSRYRPLSVLGEGGMGKVYLAEQKLGTATRKVAIKTLHPELANDPQIIARFQRESETVIELRHPNTIQFYDFGELDDKTLIIVMEYIRGKALAAVLEEEGALDPQRADKIMIQICGSLHEAHQRGIIHRDLKPENVLLTDQGGQRDFVKVLDFGIAKRDDAEDPNQAKLTKQGMVLGTPPYMSPEQFSGQKLDARSDVYSLGVMAYEMLTAKLPFDAATPWEWATKHLTAQPTPMEAHPAGAQVPPRKKQAVLRALSKDRNARQTSVLEFLQEFTGYQDANAAWTMATSAGGAILPKTSTPAARPPAPTPTPSWAGAAAQHESGFGAQGGSGSQPGLASHPGYGSVPGPTSTPGHGSVPGYAGPGYAGHANYPDYHTGPQPKASGGIIGKLLAVGLVGFFVLAGGAGGLAWYLSQDESPEPVGANTNTATAGSDGPGLTDPQFIPTVPPETDDEPSGQADVAPGDEQPSDGQPSDGQPSDGQPSDGQPSDGQPSDGSDEVTPIAPTQVETEPVERPTTPTRPSTPRRPPGPSAADQARARSLTVTGMNAARRNDFAGAVAALRQAQRAVGRRNSMHDDLRDELSRRGSNQVGILLQQGHCEQARALYRQLQSVGASTAARRQFGDWCPAR